MVKRQKKESNAIAEDFFDDLRSMMGCSKYQSECYICEKIPAIEHLNYCPDCNSNFCDVSIISFKVLDPVNIVNYTMFYSFTMY